MPVKGIDSESSPICYEKKLHFLCEKTEHEVMYISIQPHEAGKPSAKGIGMLLWSACHSRHITRHSGLRARLLRLLYENHIPNSELQSPLGHIEGCDPCISEDT